MSRPLHGVTNIWDLATDALMSLTGGNLWEREHSCHMAVGGRVLTSGSAFLSRLKAFNLMEKPRRKAELEHRE